MMDGVNQNYISAYRELLAEVPEFRQKIEDRKFTHNDILEIARSLLVQKGVDGTISIEKRLYKDTKSEIPKEQITLIRKICSAPNVQMKRGQKHIQEEEENIETSSKKSKIEKENVSIVRRSVKRKQEEQEDKPTKRQKQEKLESSTPKISEAEDIFRFDSKAPDALLGLITEYVEESPAAIVDFSYNVNKKPIPGYLKGRTHLDLSNERLTLATFMTIVSEFKNLKSIELPEDADDSWLEELSNKLKNLESLDVRCCNNITDEGLGHITSNMKSLKNLNLSYCENIGDEGVGRIFQELRLESLNLCGCSKITDEAFKNIKENGESLQELDLTSTNISDKCFGYISYGAKSLKTLVLACCEGITDAAINLAVTEFKELEHLNLVSSNVTDSGLVNLSQIAKTLKSLKLESCKNITGEFLSHIDQNLEALKTLSFSSIPVFNVSNFIHIYGKLPAIENLNLGGIKNLTDEVIGNIVQGAQKLESLNLGATEVGNEGLKSVASNCPNLKELMLRFCKNELNAGIGYIIDGCQDLQRFDIRGTNVDDNGLESIAKKPRKLITLNLDSCSKITDKGLKSISIGCPDLRSINLGRCNITDDGILYLSKGVKTLQNIEISENNRISSKTIDYILKWKDSIESIHIIYCKNIDDEALTHFSPGLPILQSLSLSGNKNITSDGLRDFAKLFPCLNKLTLADCNQITDSCLPYLKELPRLEDLNLSFCNITDDGLRQIIHFQALRYISFFQCKGLSAEEINNLRNGGIKVSG